ncbi:unnamed protein product [Lupinus luteus]|uniref:GH16 domain-containing protein n=1 Tax=Lupinus luteus TaxID=3873 RepID=A0AAV1XS58_LUPLU
MQHPFFFAQKKLQVASDNMGPMAAEASIWNGDNWASGGRKIDWSKAPFQLHYRGFTISPS